MTTIPTPVTVTPCCWTCSAPWWRPATPSSASPGTAMKGRPTSPPRPWASSWPGACPGPPAPTCYSSAWPQGPLVPGLRSWPGSLGSTQGCRTRRARRLQHPDRGGGLRAVHLEQHDRPGQAGCQTEQAGAGPPGRHVEVTLPQEAAGATAPAPLQWGVIGGHHEPVTN